MAERNGKKSGFGGCNYQAASPKVEDLGPGTKVVNIRLSFEEALKLSLAVDECVRYLNRTKRRTKQGRRSGMRLAIYLSKERIAVTKGQMPAKPGRKPEPAAAEPTL